MLTVKQFLDKRIVTGYKILYGGSMIFDRKIEHISVAEYPTEDFLRPNEMVLSAAVGLDDPDTFIAFLEELNAVSGAALVLSSRNDEYTLPMPVIEYLEHDPIPIILFPWSCRYADVVEEVLKLLRDDMMEDHLRYEELQKYLLEEYLSGQDMQRAVQVIADKLNSRVAIFDYAGICRGFSSNMAQKTEQQVAVLYEDSRNTVQIVANQQSYGKIYIKQITGKRTFNRELFKQYLSWPLALWFDKEWVIQIANQDIKDDFVWRLTRCEEADFEQFNKEGKRLGFYLHGPYTCIIGNVHLQENGDKDAKELWSTININTVKERVLHVARQLDWHVMVTYQQDLLIMFIQEKGEKDAFGAEGFLDHLEAALQEVFPQVWYTWGISEAGGDPTDFSRCFQDAKLAQELCVYTPGKNSRFLFKSTIVYNALSLLYADKDLSRSIIGVVEPLYEHDKNTGIGLVDTLRCYLECKNLSETARLLHLHRHSLLYRISKIEELTGLSLKNPDSFFLLELSVRMSSQDKLF